jgi:hypothetical protein
MDNGDSAGPRPGRGQVWFYVLGGPVLLLALYQFLFRRGLLDASLLSSPVRGPIIALMGAVLGWLTYRIVSQPN